MCGIAGLLGRLDGPVLKRLSRAIAHRGPDGEGIWQDEAAGIGLVHRRLSIIDLTPAAAQPMLGSDGRYVTIFNGEIYNYQSLARTLAAKGYAFNSNSDTAILAPLYDLKGPEMLHELEGIFAFAIWDRRAASLFLARDHAGVKPFYYSIAGNRLAFASELRAVREAIETISADTDAMAQYLSFLWTPGERTLFNEIRKLRPGHYLTAAFNGGRLRTNISRWYKPPQAPMVNNRPVYDGSKNPDQLLGLLDRVVGEQCLSDVPVGAFLSGGADSSAVVASMVATGHRPAQTYCIGFLGGGLSREGFDDDLEYARRVAKHLGLPLKEIVIEEADLVDQFPGLAVLLDEPTSDSAPLLVQMIAVQARSDNIKVLLSGTGGDDVFSGYRRHLAASLRERLRPWGALVAAGTSLLSLVAAGGLKRRAEKFAALIGAGNDDEFLLGAFSGNSVPDAPGLLKKGKAGDTGYLHDNALLCALEESRGRVL